MPITSTGKTINNQQYDLQIKFFEELRATLKQIPGAINTDDPIDTKCKEEALAFLVEATKQIEPKDWQSRLNDLNKRYIKIIRENQTNLGKAHEIISWDISQLISNLYDKTIGIQAVKANHNGQDDRCKMLSRELKLYKSFEEFEALLHKNHDPVSFGHIMPEFVPKWYHEFTSQLH